MGATSFQSPCLLPSSDSCGLRGFALDYVQNVHNDAARKQELIRMALSLLAILGALAVAIPLALWYSFAVSILWGWFIVPPFHAPPLSTWQMFAVVLTLSAIRPNLKVGKEPDIDWEKLVFVLIGPALSLGIGAAVKFWILD